MNINHTGGSAEASSTFVTQHGDKVSGVLSGFDRLLLVAHFRSLYHAPFMGMYLSRAKVLLKDFVAFASTWTERIRISALELAERSGRPHTYLNSGRVRKEALARAVAQRDGIASGLIGLWSAVEPCLTFFVRGDRKEKKLVLRLEPSKCLHYYFYFMHEQFGLMHLRLQTWFPFALTVCLNGRHWLARQMDQEGLGYLQRENCFTHLENPARAQALAEAQLKSHWPSLLQPLINQCHPHAAEIGRPLNLSYYWSVRESEFATDVMFKDPATLTTLYPQLIEQGIKHFRSADVLRFLGAKVRPDNRLHGTLAAEVLTSYKARPEGLRIKHQVQGNSLKMYDKQGSVLRVETTLNNPHQFRVFRPSEKNPDGPSRWQVLRKSIGDLHRRAEICQTVNGRYLHALAQVRSTQKAGDLVDGICQPVTKEGRRHRALNPWSKEDSQLLELINRGEWMISGFRNRDLRDALYPGSAGTAERRRQSGRVTRALGRLRAHGLIKKVGTTYRYQLSEKGRLIITALLSARHADVEKLFSLAA